MHYIGHYTSLLRKLLVYLQKRPRVEGIIAKAFSFIFQYVLNTNSHNIAVYPGRFFQIRNKANCSCSFSRFWNLSLSSFWCSCFLIQNIHN
jgi:hypothetical protein